MNYYEHHIGDYAAATAHLSWDEDMAYTRLLRAYYHQERGIPQGQQYRLARATTAAQRKAVDAVLAEFFTLSGDTYSQKRADEEISLYRDGEPEREARKTNESLRLKRHREERARLFKVINESGQHVAWNVSMNELREVAKRCSQPLPATAPETPATATHTPIPIPNTQSQSSQPKVARVERASAPPRPPDVSEQVWSDWTAMRRSKKAPVSQTALDGAIAEAEKAHMTLDAFLREWCTRGSQGLKADWLVGRNGSPAAPRKADKLMAGNIEAGQRYLERMGDE